MLALKEELLIALDWYRIGSLGPSLLKPSPSSRNKTTSDHVLSVYPTNLTSYPLQLPSQIHGIPPDTKVLGAYWTSDLNTLKPLFLLLFQLIFKASKA
jgi:hypothetical protein